MTSPCRLRRLSRVLPLVVTASLFAPAALLAQVAGTAVDGIPSTPIEVPPPVPTGILLAWKPMLLQVRIDNGSRAAGNSLGGSDKLQPLRGLIRYTKLFDQRLPLVGRFELEGGQFQSDATNTNSSGTSLVGSTGTDFTGRALLGVATRVSPGITVLASVGGISRYQYGRGDGGAPRIGIFGAATNMEIEFAVYPAVMLSLFAEAALAPFPFGAQDQLGDLSDASEFRGRVQLSFDLSKNTALDVGFDFTRWHATFVNSKVFQPPTGVDPATWPGQAVLFENREHALTLGVRWKL